MPSVPGAGAGAGAGARCKVQAKQRLLAAEDTRAWKLWESLLALQLAEKAAGIPAEPGSAQARCAEILAYEEQLQLEQIERAAWVFFPKGPECRQQPSPPDGRETARNVRRLPPPCPRCSRPREGPPNGDAAPHPAPQPVDAAAAKR